MTESKMETKTFAELRVVALWPGRQDGRAKGEGDHPTWCGRLFAEFYYLAGILWLSLGNTVAQRLALLLHGKIIPDFHPSPSPVCVALAMQVWVSFHPVVSSHIKISYSL